MTNDVVIRSGTIQPGSISEARIAALSEWPDTAEGRVVRAKFEKIADDLQEYVDVMEANGILPADVIRTDRVRVDRIDRATVVLNTDHGPVLVGSDWTEEERDSMIERVRRRRSMSDPSVPARPSRWETVKIGLTRLFRG